MVKAAVPETDAHILDKPERHNVAAQVRILNTLERLENRIFIGLTHSRLPSDSSELLLSADSPQNLSTRR